MINKFFKCCILTMLLCSNAFCHSGKPKYHIAIDTDGALDDMRAISLLLSDNDLCVLGITCSQGSLLPETSFQKVSSLLSVFHHEGIPVGLSIGTAKALPEWNSFDREIPWGEEQDTNTLISALQPNTLLNNAVVSSKNKLTLIALGSLKTYADWLRFNPEQADNIERIIWYNHHNISEGFNYSLSPESYHYIKDLGILIEIVANTRDHLLVDQTYLNCIGKVHSVYSKQIEILHSQDPVVEKTLDRSLHLQDDLVPLYLSVPIFFDCETKENIKQVSLKSFMPSDFVYETMAAILVSSESENNRVFSSFPVDSSLYKKDYAVILNETIRNFGSAEWKAICMTNEIHGHTGIYSIIGAKMGVRAMEYFNVGVNNMEVITFAGKVPPLSCFNDGIQISTGSTVGQGLLLVSDSVSVLPSAIFVSNGREVHIALKQELLDQIQSEIDHAIKNFGLLSDSYWLYIEQCAIKWWAEYDRHEMFQIINLN